MALRSTLWTSFRFGRIYRENACHLLILFVAQWFSTNLHFLHATLYVQTFSYFVGWVDSTLLYSVLVHFSIVHRENAALEWHAVLMVKLMAYHESRTLQHGFPFNRSVRNFEELSFSKQKCRYFCRVLYIHQNICNANINVKCKRSEIRQELFTPDRWMFLTIQIDFSCFSPYYCTFHVPLACRRVLHPNLFPSSSLIIIPFPRENEWKKNCSVFLFFWFQVIRWIEFWMFNNEFICVLRALDKQNIEDINRTNSYKTCSQ